jgi:stage II sporulation protein AA (anti-sigma F factor antagonist)
MKLQSGVKGKYTVLQIEQEDDSIQELFELKDAITRLLEEGIRSIAVRFANVSYIYSGEIRVLISCYKLVQSHGGTLCIVEPKDTVRKALQNLKLDQMIRIFDSEAAL